MSEEQVVISVEPKKPSWVTLLATSGCAIFVCVFIFIGTLIFAGPEKAQEFIPNIIKEAEQRTRIMANSNTMGDPNAPVHIIEYGDFQCPYCLKFWKESEPQLIEQYVNTGKVYFEYRNFAFLGQESIDAAEAAYCAGDQGKFWEYHDTLFINWKGENIGAYSQKNLIKFAKIIDLDQQEFETCISERMHQGTVEHDLAQAEADGIRATPTFLINGYKVEGAQSFEALQKLIEEILQGSFNQENG